MLALNGAQHMPSFLLVPGRLPGGMECPAAQGDLGCGGYKGDHLGGALG